MKNMRCRLVELEPILTASKESMAFMCPDCRTKKKAHWINLRLDHGNPKDNEEPLWGWTGDSILNFTVNIAIDARATEGCEFLGYITSGWVTW